MNWLVEFLFWIPNVDCILWDSFFASVFSFPNFSIEIRKKKFLRKPKRRWKRKEKRKSTCFCTMGSSRVLWPTKELINNCLSFVFFLKKANKQKYFFLILSSIEFHQELWLLSKVLEKLFFFFFHFFFFQK